MAKKGKAGSGNSVSAGRDVTGSVITQGKKNRVKASFRLSIFLPRAASTSRRSRRSRSSSAACDPSDDSKIKNALEDADTETKKPKPDKDEVGGALERAIKYAKKATGFATAVEALKPHVERAAAWLGTNWHVILGYLRP